MKKLYFVLVAPLIGSSAPCLAGLDGIQKDEQSLPHRVTLSLKSNSVQISNSQLARDMLERLQRERLEIERKEGLQINPPNTQNLDLSVYQVGEKNKADLLDILNESCKVQDLNLNGQTAVDDDFISKLVQSGKAARLTNINLSGTNITGQSLETLPENVAVRQDLDLSVRCVGEKTKKDLHDIIKKNRSVQGLNLKGQTAVDDDFISELEQSGKAERLTNINLSKTNITGKSLETLLKSEKVAVWRDFSQYSDRYQRPSSTLYVVARKALGADIGEAIDRWSEKPVGPFDLIYGRPEWKDRVARCRKEGMRSSDQNALKWLVFKGDPKSL